MSNKIFDIKAETAPDLSKTIAADPGGARDAAMLKLLQKSGRSKAQKNLSQVTINHNVTRKLKVALALMPQWGAHIPPYNLARITALSRASGFDTLSCDINIACYARCDKDHWNNYSEWKWTNDVYYTDIHPQLSPVLEEFLEKIVAFAPDVMGFSLYNTNNKSTVWMMQQIKSRLPNVKIIVGGPQTLSGNLQGEEFIDHVVMGEGEAIFLDLMDKFEAGTPVTEKFLQHDKSIRIDLDSLPYPDYTDMDISLYNENGVSAELSRGCIAKCQFCSETTFWRYRQRLANNILDEIQHQYDTLGIKFVWFIDSLVNGNLNELRAFAQGLVDRNIHIGWMGYARCDERMDDEYIHVLKQSGCNMLSFGAESGSQHVLDIMKKNVNRNAIEQNLKGFTAAGITSHTNWFVGFPGERPVDLADTMTLMWRTRNCMVWGRSTGTCQLTKDTPIQTDSAKFGIAPGFVANQWYSTDFKNTIIHRLIRYKSINIILNHLIKNRDADSDTMNERPGIEKPEHYELTYDVANVVTDIPYEPFDYDIIKIEDHPLNASVVNEIWPLLRVLWLAVGPYKLKLHFDPKIDTHEFGAYNLPKVNSYYKADYNFEIDANGNWSADFDHEIFIHSTDYPPGVVGEIRQVGEEFRFSMPWQGQGHWIRPATTLIP